MKRLLIGILAVALAASAQKADEAERLLRAAMNTELVDGDLKGAIEQYKKVALGTNRSAAARSLIQMAECYQKLGDGESRKIYERVLREYGDQKDAATVARTRLGRNVAQNDTGVVVRQVWTGEDVSVGGTPSPDGRYFVFVDLKTQNLAIRDLRSDESRLITRDARTEGREVGAATPIFSPDGKQVAYQWYDQGISLRLIGADGSRMRVLTKPTQSVRPIPVAWSPDGKQIAVLMTSRQDRTNQIALVSTATGVVTTLKSLAWRAPRFGGFSPDGRFLVYSLPKSNPAANDGGIFAISTDGGGERALVQGPANDGQPAWTPDGRSVVFTSDRSGTVGLWSIRVSDGKPQSSPELVRANLGDVTTMGFSRDGAYFYGTYNSQADVYVADIEPKTLKATSAPSRLTEKFVGSNGGASWSPDGKSIAFYRASDRRTKQVVIRNVSTGEERTLPLRFEDGYVPGYFSPLWFPDGRSLLVLELANARRIFRRIDIESGEGRVIFETRYIHPGVALSPDGKTLYYSIRDEATAPADLSLLRLIKRNLEAGDEVELYRAKTPGVAFFGMGISPDGSMLSFIRNDVEVPKRTLLTIPTQGGTPRELIRTTTYNEIGLFGGAWTRDGRHVLFTANKDEGHQVWAIPAEGGEASLLDTSPQRRLFPSFSPDGRQILFTGIRSKGEISVILNLLSKEQSSR